MPAKVGPKRDRALAQAGCYFDSSAARCGTELFDLRRESDGVRAIEIVMSVHAGVQCALTCRRHCEPTGRREAPPDDRLREAIHLSAHQVTRDCFAEAATQSAR